MSPDTQNQTGTPRPLDEGCVPPGAAPPFAGECRLLVSLDYDGTLRAREGNPVPQDFVEHVMAWRTMGLRWGINTGRSLPYLLHELLECCPVLPDFICTCERYVYMADAGGKLLPATAHNDECHRANMELRERFRPVLHAALDSLRERCPELEWVIAEKDPLSIETPDPAAMDALMPHLSPLAPPGVAIQRAGRYLRFSDARFSKGTALRYVVEQWRIPQERLFIMGDGQNDLDAFRLFPRACCTAPADAHPEVLSWLRERGYTPSASTGVLPALCDWVLRNTPCNQ